VAQPGQDRRLVHELLHAAAAVIVQPLHGNRSAVAEEPLVHGAEAAFADLSLVAEAVRRVLQLERNLRREDDEHTYTSGHERVLVL
jgi:hypothetical protein